MSVGAGLHGGNLDVLSVDALQGLFTQTHAFCPEGPLQCMSLIPRILMGSRVQTARQGIRTKDTWKLVFFFHSRCEDEDA